MTSATNWMVRSAVALLLTAWLPGNVRAQDELFPNGFETANGAYFVSPDGLDTNPGTMAQPFLTIAKGIAAANADAINKSVRVAQGTYDESITLVGGVSLFGQYQAGAWTRDPSNYTIIAGAQSVGIHERAVSAANVTTPTVFDGFVVLGPVNDSPGGNSYAIYVSASNANLQITNDIVLGGRGGPGVDGANGPDGSAGVAGGGRNPNLAVSDAAYDAFGATGTGECNTSNNRQHANGGQFTCGAASVNGGSGGGNQCPVMSYCDNGDVNFGCQQNTINFHWNNFTPLAGANGVGAGSPSDGAAGAGAAQGNDMIQIWANFYGGYICYIPPGLTYGLNGANGDAGAAATAVAGCAAAAGGVSGGDWIGGIAPTGLGGGAGGGGGGGGAGGGGKCENDGFGHTVCTLGTGKDTLGAHGGGGASGGCGGAGGNPGGAGGGAFGIFIVGGSAPVVTGNTLIGGSGGAGGSGGNGGFGAAGGAGGLGGTTGVPVVFCTDGAGRGGNGGTGGDGSGGGGGCGGASAGIYTFGIGAPNYCDAAANNTINAGAPGAGGAGGLSLHNAAGDGAPGTAAGCSFN